MKVPWYIAHFSTFINKLFTGEKYPVCYTAYRNKGNLWRLLDFLVFWDKQHCRKVYLSRRIEEINKK